MLELCFVIACASILTGVLQWMHWQERRELMSRIQNPYHDPLRPPRTRAKEADRAARAATARTLL